MSVRSRNESPVRQAFAAGADGLHAALADELYGTVSIETAIKKLGRVLGAGQADDLNPPWALLDAILEQDPGRVLALLAEAVGYETPRKIAPSTGELLQEALEGQAALEGQIKEIGAKLETLCKLEFQRSKREPAPTGRPRKSA